MAGYATAAQVKNYAQVNKTAVGKESWLQFGFAASADFDTWLTELIGWADQEINNYCEHDFYRHPATSGEATEQFDGLGHTILLVNFPILSLSKVELRTSQTYGSWFELISSYYQVYERYVRFSTKLPVGDKNVRITYAYGYTAVPGPVALASIRIVANILQGALQRSTSPIVRVDQFVVEQARELAFTDDIKDLLLPYRRIPHEAMNI